jgi:hypothetical protein
MSSRPASSRVFSPLLGSARVVDNARLPEGVSAMLALGVRMFLVVIGVLAVVAVAFLIATA